MMKNGGQTFPEAEAAMTAVMCRPPPENAQVALDPPWCVFASHKTFVFFPTSPSTEVSSMFHILSPFCKIPGKLSPISSRILKKGSTCSKFPPLQFRQVFRLEIAIR